MIMTSPPVMKFGKYHAAVKISHHVGISAAPLVLLVLDVREASARPAAGGGGPGPPMRLPLPRRRRWVLAGLRCGALLPCSDAMRVAS
jgi:hypothetical protein